MNKNRFLSVIYLLPTIVIFTMLVIIPLLLTLYLSFFDWNMVSPNMKFVGFNNYIQVVTEKTFIKTVFNTGLYVITLVLINFGLSYVFAFVLEYMIPYFKDFFKATFFLPSFLSLMVSATLYNWILNPVAGPLQRMLSNFGLSLPNWSVTEGLVILVICYMTSWQVFGYNFITLYSAIAGIDKEVIECAKLDNIPNRKIFSSIVIPMTSSSGLYILIMSIVTGLQSVYAPIHSITKGGPNGASTNLLFRSYEYAFITFKSGHSAALSVISVIIFVGLFILFIKYSEKVVYYEN